MVRGSGQDPETNESNKTKFLYDGTIEQWDVGKITIKSTLYQKGLWDVVKHGPQQPLPSYVPPYNDTAADSAQSDGGDYYYALQDMITQGPVSHNQPDAVHHQWHLLRRDRHA